jgi:hypothetical protein
MRSPSAETVNEIGEEGEGISSAAARTRSAPCRQKAKRTRCAALRQIAAGLMAAGRRPGVNGMIFAAEDVGGVDLPYRLAGLTAFQAAGNATNSQKQSCSVYQFSSLGVAPLLRLPILKRSPVQAC